jgi:ribonuclease Z
MSMRIIFLGTAGSVPTLKRNLPAVLVCRKNDQILFDCGEGVQRQMLMAKTGFHENMKIFLSHMHGDHVLGLPGLMQTMALMDRRSKLQVYGPNGIRHFLQSVKEALQFGLTYPVEIHEIYSAGTICEEAEYTIEAAESNHVMSSFAYAFIEKQRPGKFYPEKAKAMGVPEGELWSKLQRGEKVKLANGKTVKPEDIMGSMRKGRKIVYTGDTRPFKDFARFASGANLLIHDATLDDTLVEKANQDGHSTPSQAAEQAAKAKAKRLILTHISARYPDAKLLLDQAQKGFKNVAIAEDFLEIELPLEDT